MLGMTAQQDLAEDLNTLILHEYQLNRNCSHSTQPSMSRAHHTERLLCSKRQDCNNFGPLKTTNTNHELTPASPAF